MKNLKKLKLTIITMITISICFLFDCKAVTKHINCTSLITTGDTSFYMCNIPNGDVCYILNNKAISCKFANN
jgi:hypothetical protein